MADFLTRLIERTVGTAEVVQPLKTPMFAWGKHALGDLSASVPMENEPPSSKENIGIDDYTTDRQPSSEAALPLRLSITTENGLSRESVPASIQTDFAVRTGEELLNVSGGGREDAGLGTLVPDTAYRKGSPSPEREKVARTGLEGTWDSNVIERGGTINQVDSLLFSPFQTPIESRVQPERIVEHRSPLPEIASPRIIENHTDVVKPHGDLKKAGKLDTDSPVLVPMSRSIYFEGASVSETKQAGPFDAFLPHSWNNPSAGPPAIKVTIGRVEVRAVMSPVPPERAKPLRPSPGLSLEEYLKQRSQGKP